eukprot:16431113-Heterocapsa_arctica.AAC.1
MEVCYLLRGPPCDSFLCESDSGGNPLSQFFLGVREVASALAVMPAGRRVSAHLHVVRKDALWPALIVFPPAAEEGVLRGA